MQKWTKDQIKLFKVLGWQKSLIDVIRNNKHMVFTYQGVKFILPTSFNVKNYAKQFAEVLEDGHRMWWKLIKICYENILTFGRIYGSMNIESEKRREK